MSTQLNVEHLALQVSAPNFGAPIRHQVPEARPHRLRLVRGLHVHPVPRMNMCLVRSPGAVGVHTLNRSAWRLLELCALGDERIIRSMFLKTVGGSPRQALHKFEHVLAQLVQKKLVVWEAAETEA